MPSRVFVHLRHCQNLARMTLPLRWCSGKVRARYNDRISQQIGGRLARAHASLGQPSGGRLIYRLCARGIPTIPVTTFEYFRLCSTKRPTFPCYTHGHRWNFETQGCALSGMRSRHVGIPRTPLIGRKYDKRKVSPKRGRGRAGHSASTNKCRVVYLRRARLGC
jgi:hypothetical protein